jgi:multidrug efflux pump subunit AcrA (membrane-fusion protein)
VLRQEGRHLRETAVELGARNGTDVEIRSGLAEGDQVARNGAAESSTGETG